VRDSMVPQATPGATALARGGAVWVVIACAETVHGALRSLLLVPVVGQHRAGQVGVIVGSIIILGVAWLFIRWIGAVRTPQLLGVGGLWLVLMLAFEIGLGRALGISWDRVLSDYDLTRGGLMLIGMVVLFLAPLLAARLRKVGGTAKEA
jgi:hypothetical protein